MHPGDTWHGFDTLPDDYQAMRKETERLAKENAELKRQLADAQRAVGSTPAPGNGGRKLELPSDEEIDKAIGQLEKYIRKFKGLIEKYGEPDKPGRPL